MAQPGDGSTSLEKAVEEGPVAAPEQDQFLHTNATSNSTDVDDVTHNEHDVKPSPGVQVNEGPGDMDQLLSHLPEDEKRILKLQLHEPKVTASFATLYRYATMWDIVIMIVSAICSIAAGAAMPLFTVCSSPPPPPFFY